MPKIIINADDYGMNSSVNMGIIGSFNNGHISSATMMANMPGFEEACQLAHDHGVTDRIGLHFNITQGRPLTSPIQKERRFCDDDGNFIFSKYNGLWLSRSEQEALAAELTAQWKKCQDAGIGPSHLDSHHHIHTAWGVARVIIRLSRKLGIRAVRKNWNIVPKTNFGKRAYLWLLEAAYRRAGLDATPYAAHVAHASWAIQNGKTPLEIMVHPALVDGVITDVIERRPLSELVQDFRDGNELYSYRDLLECGNRS